MSLFQASRFIVGVFPGATPLSLLPWLSFLTFGQLDKHIETLGTNISSKDFSSVEALFQKVQTKIRNSLKNFCSLDYLLFSEAALSFGVRENESELAKTLWQ